MKHYDQPVINYRCWRIREKKGKLILKAAYTDSYWKKSVLKAKCEDDWCSKAPGKDCECGFNGFYRLPKNKLLNRTRKSFIWGAIACAGKMRRHEIGIRAERAQILAFYVPEGLRKKDKYCKKVRRLSKRYGVPVFEDYKKMNTYLKNYGLIKKDKPRISNTYDVERAIGVNPFKEITRAVTYTRTYTSNDSSPNRTQAIKPKPKQENFTFFQLCLGFFAAIFIPCFIVGLISLI